MPKVQKRRQCTKAENQLIVANLKLVDFVCHRFYRARPGLVNSVAYEDLQGAGRWGLIKGVQDFDSSKGFAISSYLVARVTGEIKHYIRDKGEFIRNRDGGESWGKVSLDALSVDFECSTEEDGDWRKEKILEVIDDLSLRQRQILTSILENPDRSDLYLAKKIGIKHQAFNQGKHRAIKSIKLLID